MGRRCGVMCARTIQLRYSHESTGGIRGDARRKPQNILHVDGEDTRSYGPQRKPKSSATLVLSFS